MISAFLTYKTISNTKDFYCKRIQWLRKRMYRLAPLYYFFIIVSFVGIIVNGHSVSFGPGFIAHGYIDGIMFILINTFNLLIHFLFLQSLLPFCSNNIIGVEWYVSCLMIYYLISAFFLVNIKTTKTLFVVLWCSIVFTGGIECLPAPSILGEHVAQFYDWLKYFAPWVNFPVWLIGFICYRVYCREVRVVYILMTLLIVIVLEKIVSIYVIFSFALLCILYLSVNMSSFNISFFIFYKIGNLSYFIYFCHVFIIRAYNEYLQAIMKDNLTPLICIFIKFLAVTIISYSLAEIWSLLTMKGREFFD